MKDRNNGFTLVELMIVIAITAVASVIVLPNLRNIKDEQLLSTSAVQMQTDLRSAQSNAASGFGTCANRQNIGWEIVFNDANTYKIKMICPGVGSPGNYPPAALETEMKSVDLKPITISAIATDSCTSTTKFSSKAVFDNVTSAVSFSVPDCLATNNQLIITLSLSATTKSITIEKGGRIYVQ